MHPYLLHSGHLYLPTFGVLAALGLMIGLGLTERTARKVGLDPEKLWNASLFTVISAFVLSRLLLIVQHFSTFRRFPILLLAVPSLTATGLLLTAVATFVWLRRSGLPILPTLDAWGPSGLLLWGFLALGHCAEGSDPGMPTSLPWGLRVAGETVTLHPVPLYAAVIAFTLAALVYAQLNRRLPGQSAGLALASSGLAQVALSFIRQPSGELLGGIETLEWLGLAIFIVGTLLWALTRPVQQPGLSQV